MMTKALHGRLIEKMDRNIFISLFVNTEQEFFALGTRFEESTVLVESIRRLDLYRVSSNSSKPRDQDSFLKPQYHQNYHLHLNLYLAHHLLFPKHHQRVNMELS